MNIKIAFILLTIGLMTSGKGFPQNELKPVEHKIIAEGTDSPISELQIVCFNKYFNKDYLSAEFRNKYDLDDKKFYKKKMLIEIFQSDKYKKGLDKIDLIGIWETNTELIVEYNIVNSDSDNDHSQLSPFMIIQVPKSKKKITFKASGKESGKATEIFLD